MATNRHFQKRVHYAKMTSAERADLQTKRMTLHLELKASQQKAVYALLLKRIEQNDKYFAESIQNKELGKQLTDTERYQHQAGKLDDQIAFQNEMKSILDEAQYGKWKAQHEKAGKRTMMRKHHKRQGN